MKIYNRTDIRPEIKGINDVKNKTIEEAFQNQTLRPIIKMQHNLLVAYFGAYIVSSKSKFDVMSNLKKNEFIRNVFKKDNTFKAELKGIIIGQFTLDEYQTYCRHKSDFNKRILTMVEQRITSVLKEF